nr:AAA family ATPase [uncultured Acetatifactor sp.]
MADVPRKIVEAVHKELQSLFPKLDSGESLMENLIRCVEETGREFVFIIDEWDALIREAKWDAEIQSTYLNLLRRWFKNSNFTPKVVAAYMTGILPIKKDGSQSAISDFIEYPILEPDVFAEFTGFTEEEVRNLCEKYGMSFEEAKSWYDGYDFPEVGAIYNPYSVMLAMRQSTVMHTYLTGGFHIHIHVPCLLQRYSSWKTICFPFLSIRFCVPNALTPDFSV